VDDSSLDGCGSAKQCSDLVCPSWGNGSFMADVTASLHSQVFPEQHRPAPLHPSHCHCFVKNQTSTTTTFAFCFVNRFFRYTTFTERLFRLFPFIAQTTVFFQFVNFIPTLKKRPPPTPSPQRRPSASDDETSNRAPWAPDVFMSHQQ
jgi:hypothetical protein